MLGRLSERYRALPIQVKASFWFLVCSFFQRGISSITTPIFTRLLTTTEYGQYNVFNSWMGIITVFVSMNLCAGVYTQGLIKFDKEQNIFSSSLQGFTLTLVSAWTAIYLLFRSFWNDIFSLTTIQMLAMLLMIWSSAVFGFWASEQRVKLSYAKLVIVTLLVSIAKPVIGIIFVTHAEDKVTARILGLALVELIGYFWLFVSQMKRGGRFFSAYYWKYALLFNLPLIPHYLSQTVLSSSDRIMINNMVGESEAGIYSLAYSIAMIMTLLNTALSNTVSPWVYQKIKDKKIRDIEPIAYITLMFIAGVNIALIAFAPEIVSIFAPESYREAIWVIPPVAMSVYFMFAYDLFGMFEFYFEKTKFIMLASIAAAVMNIMLNYIFINLFGYMAAGYTTLFCYILYTTGHFVFMRRVCKTCMGGEKVYSIKKLLAISSIFMVCGFVFMCSYRLTAVRYGIFTIFIIIAMLYRKLLISAAKQLVSVKNNK